MEYIELEPLSIACIDSPPAPEPARAHAVRYVDHSLPSHFIPGQWCRAWVDVRNEGTQRWEPHPPDGQAVNLVLRVEQVTHQFPLPHPVDPQEAARVQMVFLWPSTSDPVVLTVDMVKQNVTYFSDARSALLQLTSNVTANPPTYGVDFLEFSSPATVCPKARFGIWVRLRNSGSLHWDISAASGRRVRVVAWINGHIVAGESLPAPVGPLQICDLHMVVSAPVVPGQYVLEVNLVHEGITYFKAKNVSSMETPLTVSSASVPAGAALYDTALRSNWAFYHPSLGVSRLADGTALPQVLERAKGCHVWDLDGRRFIDYTMGWGCALLGHGNDVVEAAVRRSMGCGPTLPLPHRLELELTDMLCQTAEIPCAEVVAFGKNGSDVCTLAVRLARQATGRKIILFCGYHGWQDWYSESLGFGGTGVPERQPSLVLRVDFNDTTSLTRLIVAHRRDLAGVIMEPSGASGGHRMVGEDIDLEFLQTAASATREAGAVLIFDEIITGFRYPKGSVQKATGVVPDMACFGKAVGNGYPISVLLGRHSVMRHMDRTFYGPTFKGEVYSMAAAQAALTLYRTEPVIDHVWAYGRRLQEGISRLCAEAGLDASIAGPPFRTVLHFNETDPKRHRLIRTLYLQELLRGGLITYSGIMLPSYAHTEAELEETLSVISSALRKVKQCNEGGLAELHRAIEIPLVR
ncbi:aminotransferase class III-fold pyridoxal phosphate-dependent enzyme [Nitrosomonas sp. Nm34]|uniref:aminotransferase class III-fold pyridoxal phosphate-dependent enzyme n=1 Tax=Nitrosomonas sp. Nm34 TaxID=1881055 RepID=UPI0008E49C90|nr:aminotransferase class III-fold pyridoxal phosphate-dependent enzyme [Nitrosomonas sp. Nm34]SFI57982.1 Glutamate-1-semialdehyde aminotransferase [Nitrosomonas sp. Nm34]